MPFYVVRERERERVLTVTGVELLMGFMHSRAVRRAPWDFSPTSLSIIYVQSSTCRCIFLMDNHPIIYCDNDTIIIGKTFPFDRQILSINVLDSHTKVNEPDMKQ